jgi:3-oxoisoapionate kinase
MSDSHLQLAYFADDFTGATDVLESLARAGLKVRLFLEPPTLEQCRGLDAIGVAGLTRSLAPDAMEAVLRPALTALRDLGPRHVHYKVCSTFDSSPTVGSIGRAIDVGAAVFGERPVPVLVAAPALGRYCAFGNLYARFGIGSAGAIYRLDRHPAISRHPVTPMTEADLRVHLGKQTGKRIGLLDVTALDASPTATTAAFQAQLAAGAQIVLIDGLNDTHLLRAGALIDSLASNGPLFSVGSSGIESALTAHWANDMEDKPDAPLAPALPPRTAPLLVVSGSCSTVTAGQIDWALAHGFTGIRFDPQSPDQAAAQQAALHALRAGKHAVIYTSRGQAEGIVTAEQLGAQLGGLTRHILAEVKVQGLVIAGGDTSSYVARALGITSLEILAPLAPGAPWCRAQAPGTVVDLHPVNFKGGQVGAENYFATAAGS